MRSDWHARPDVQRLQHRAPITVAGEKQYLRVSTALFNTEADIDALARAAG